MIDKRINSADNSCLWTPLQLPFSLDAGFGWIFQSPMGNKFMPSVEQVKGISKVIFGVKHVRLIRKLKSGVVNVIFRPITS